MVSPDLIDWIKRQEAKGYTSQQIYLHLVNNGYNQKDVIEAVNMSNAISGNYPGSNMPYTSQNIPNNYQNYGQQNNNSKNESNHESHKGMWVFLVILILLGAGGFYVYTSGMYIQAVEFIDTKFGTSIGVSLGITPQEDPLQNDGFNDQDIPAVNSDPIDTSNVGVQDPNSIITTSGEPTVNDVLNSQNNLDTATDTSANINDQLMETEDIQVD